MLLNRVNKPYLPIAAGDLSVQSAWLLVILFAAAGFSIVISNFGPFITSLYCLGLFLGTIYSVPPFRLKKYPVAAFLIIATVLPPLVCIYYFILIISLKCCFFFCTIKKTAASFSLFWFILNIVDINLILIRLCLVEINSLKIMAASNLFVKVK